MSLEKYSVEKLIGKGSYGEVFLAKHKKDKRMYVVKKVTLQKASERERKAAELEAQLLSQLRHPNIVSYRESFQGDKGFLYIVMNYCEGGDLYSRLKAQKSTLLDETQIVQWFVQIAMALQYMHEKHILHRDLKTQNIFLTRSKIIKLGDLGIAKVLENASDMATTLIGTPYYMSPELFSNKPYNHKSDVWALGCCLYEMCTLKHAFNAKDMSSLVYKILKGKTPPLPKQYSADLCSIIKNMLDQDPVKRPSVSRLLRHPYIKGQIAKFLEGTKNRQKQKTNSSEKKVTSMMPANRPLPSSSSDLGYADPNLQSIATVSGVECVIDVTNKPAVAGKENGIPQPVQRSHSDDNVVVASVDSSHSSTSSSGPSEKEIEVNVPSKNGVIKQNDEKEREKEKIKKQMAERRRKSASERSGVSKDKAFKEQKSNLAGIEAKSADSIKEEKTPARRALSAGSSRPSPNEIKPEARSRPLPRPPAPPPKASINDAPMSRSPRARRRYKISAKPPSQEEEEEDDDDKSTASVESDRSSHSVSESCSQQHSGLSARERRRLRQSASGSPLPSPSASYNTPLPSPKDIIADIQRKRSQDHGRRVSSNQSSLGDNKKSQNNFDSVDGPIRRPKQELKSFESEESGSDLEEISTDEPSSGPSVKSRSEVNSLISALDSTLKLVDVPPDRSSPELEDEPDKVEELTPSGASPSTSGRLRDRIERLKSECLQGIGQEMLNRAYKIIDEVSEDEVEEELVKYIGRENFEEFGGRIWQLKFCESFKIS